MYNAIGSQYLDIVVFLRRGMKPVLALDLYEEGGISEKLKEMDENVARTLKAVKLPVLKCPVRLDYDVEELRMKVIQSLNPEIVALLKENFTHQA